MRRLLPLLAIVLLGCSGTKPTADRFELEDLPQVASVSTPIDPPEPELTIVHLLDWHFIPRDLYAAELRTRQGEATEAEIERRYRDFLKEVAAVKRDQAAVLRHLAHRGITAVYQEGLTPDEVDAFAETAHGVATVEREVLEDSVKRAKKLASRTDAPAEAAKLYAMAKLGLEQYDEDRLKVGAAGELLAAGVITEVRPLEEAETLAAADPLRAGGKAVLDEGGQRQRDQAIVKRLLRCTEPVAVAILGGSHDLADELSESNRSVQYLRIAVRSYEVAGRD